MRASQFGHCHAGLCLLDVRLQAKQQSDLSRVIQRDGQGGFVLYSVRTGALDFLSSILFPILLQCYLRTRRRHELGGLASRVVRNVTMATTRNVLRACVQ